MYHPVGFLENHIELMREACVEKDIKHSHDILSLRMMLEDKDRQLVFAIEEMRELRNTMLSCQHENDKLKSDLESQKEKLKLCKDKNGQEKLNAESQNVRETLLGFQHENNQLKLELESQKENLRRCQDNNRIEQENLNSENQSICEFVLRCQQENDQLKLELESQKEILRRCKDDNRFEQAKLNSENQNMRGIMLRYQQENGRLKLDWESQKENIRRINDNNRIKREKFNSEYQKVREIMLRYQYENELLELDLAFQKENLKRCEEKNMIEQEKLIAENQKLKTRLNELEWKYGLANQDGVCNTSELNEKLDRMNKEPDTKAVQMQVMSWSINQNLVAEVQMAHHELQLTNKELTGVKHRLFEKEMESNALKKELEEINEDTQAVMSINHALLVKERISTDELQNARQQLMTGLSDFFTHRTNIGIKRMGELDQKPFRDACLEKMCGEDSGIKTAELCSTWEGNIRNSQWHPFKRIQRDSESGVQEVEAVDDDDEKLKELKDVWGQQVYEAVSVALSEMNEYNPSGRYPVPELWNFKEGRKSDLREVIEYLIKQLKSLKSAAKLKRRR